VNQISSRLARRSLSSSSFRFSSCTSKILRIRLRSALAGAVAIGTTVFGLRRLVVRRFFLTLKTLSSAAGVGFGGFRTRRFFLGMAEIVPAYGDWGEFYLKHRLLQLLVKCFTDFTDLKVLSFPASLGCGIGQNFWHT